MTIARGVAVAALALAIVLIAVLLLRGGATHQYDLLFQNAGQLVKDDDVQVGGRRIGSIRKITLTDDNRARVRVEIEEPYAPLREGSQAVIRLTSLSGIANRYIALTPAPNSAKTLDDGATLAAGSTTDVVDLDELFNTLDPPTRKDLQGVIQGFAAQYQGKGPEAAKSAEYFNPFLSTSRRLVNQLTEDEGTLTDFIVNSSRAVTAVAERRDDLADLVSNTNATAGAIGQENVALARALGRAADDAAPRQHDVREPARDARRPRRAGRRVQARHEAPRPVPARAAPAGALLAADDPRPAHASSRSPAPTTTCSTRRASCPASRSVASPIFAHSTQALQKSQPVLEFIRPYVPELTGWFHDFGQATANYDANGHFARIQPMFNAFSFDGQPGRRRAAPAGLNDEVRGPADQHRPRAARAPPASAPRTARRPTPTTATSGPTTATRASRSRGRDMKRIATVIVLLAVAAAAMLTDRRRRRRPLQGPRDLRQRRLRHHRRGRQGRRRQGRQDRLARRHARLQGGRRARHPGPRLPGLPLRRELPGAPAVADRREVRRVRADPEARRRRPRAAAAEEDRRGQGQGPVPAAGRRTPRRRSTST